MDFMDKDESPSPNPGRKNFLLPEQFQKILSYVKPELFRTVFVFLVNTGCRRSDALGLEWSSVYLAERVFRIQRDKRLKEKIVPLNQTVVSMLESLPSKQDSARVFWFAPDGDYVSEVWRKARKAAGFPNITLHDLKHTFYSLDERNRVWISM